jgi:hypothetical protein
MTEPEPASQAESGHPARSAQCSYNPVDNPSEEPFSSQLEAWLLSTETKTLGTLTDAFAEKSFAVTILFLMLLPVLPLPTGGITHIFEAVSIIVAAQMVMGARRLRIPQRLRRRDLGSSVTGTVIPFMLRRICWFEHLSRPRWVSLVNSRSFHQLSGLIFIGLAVAAALAPPFSGLDTLPAMGAVVALGLILTDVIVFGIGVAIGTGGIVLIVPVGAALFQAIRHLI